MIPPHQIVRNHYLHFSSLQIHVHITPLNNSPTINICWWSTTGEIQFWLVKSLFRHMFTGENQPKTSKSLGFIWWNPSNNRKKKTMGSSGYGSIPIDTFLVGWTSIYQLFWGSLGTRVLTHPHLGSSGILPPSVPIVPAAFHQRKGVVEGLAEATQHLGSLALAMLRQPGGGILEDSVY